MHVFLFCITALIAFFLGSIPFGVIISKFVYHTDIRSVGSGNIGTTNAFRAMGKAGGVAVFVLDFGKGVLSGLIAQGLSSLAHLGAVSAVSVFPAREDFLAIAFLGCVLGHIFSPWLHFKGGKGIAVAVGALFVVFGPAGACLELAIFAVLVVATRYVSLGSIASALACPAIAHYFYAGHWFAWLIISAAALVVVWAHRENIGRLMRGEENRIGKGRASDAQA